MYWKLLAACAAIGLAVGLITNDPWQTGLCAFSAWSVGTFAYWIYGNYPFDDPKEKPGILYGIVGAMFASIGGGFIGVLAWVLHLYVLDMTLADNFVELMSGSAASATFFAYLARLVQGVRNEPDIVQPG